MEDQRADVRQVTHRVRDSGPALGLRLRGRQHGAMSYQPSESRYDDMEYRRVGRSGLDPQNGPGPLDIGTFNTISGTSMATPHISGIVAQLFQANPAASPAQIEAALKTTAHKYTDGAAYEPGPLGTTSFDKGYGLVDVVEAANAIR